MEIVDGLGNENALQRLYNDLIECDHRNYGKQVCIFKGIKLRREEVEELIDRIPHLLKGSYMARTVFPEALINKYGIEVHELTKEYYEERNKK
ncbi:hypothetical protein [Pseudolactococcus insecticola]|uniref:Uncharacterized protein n=1 Tax=Pseudolactococcus insecticola TaxID=2709158 RepID=A0A6A0B5Z5_9LACT|nr:hypothetical protein [Lactococcus insecticola]GFH40820.1 hypothetical protein Hs20B_12180 [Lactococcus insecticola]